MTADESTGGLNSSAYCITLDNCEHQYQYDNNGKQNMARHNDVSLIGTDCNKGKSGAFE